MPMSEVTRTELANVVIRSGTHFDRCCASGFQSHFISRAGVWEVFPRAAQYAHTAYLSEAHVYFPVRMYGSTTEASSGCCRPAQGHHPVRTACCHNCYERTCLSPRCMNMYIPLACTPGLPGYCSRLPCLLLLSTLAAFGSGVALITKVLAALLGDSVRRVAQCVPEGQVHVGAALGADLAVIV